MTNKRSKTFKKRLAYVKETQIFDDYQQKNIKTKKKWVEALFEPWAFKERRKAAHKTRPLVN